MNPTLSPKQGRYPNAPLSGVGIGLRAQHYREFLEQHPSVAWLEVHTENYLDPGGWDAHVLARLRARYPISLHGVGLGLGSVRGFSEEHLKRVQELVERIEPALVSEHLCWNAFGDRRFNDLLPLSLSAEAFDLVCDRVDRVQEVLKRPVLLENVSTSLRFRGDAVGETTFLSLIADRTGCGILLDVNNLYANQCNHGEDAREAIAAIRASHVLEIHVAGHLVTPDLVVDHHGSRVSPEVWALYEATIQRFGPIPTLVEWDTDIPPLEVLLGEAQAAREALRALPEIPRPEVYPPTVSSRIARETGPSRHDPAAAQELFAGALISNQAMPLALAAFQGGSDSSGFRLNHVRQGVYAKWRRALAGAYPVLERMVGEDMFTALSNDYAEAHGSEDPDLNRYGRHFASFLSAFPHVRQYPYFPDMARLEWALHRARYADDASSMTASSLRQWGVDALDEARLRLHPACSLLEFEWEVASVWLAHQAEAAPTIPPDMKAACVRHVLVVRPQWKPTLLLLSPAGHALLQALAAGKTFGEGIDEALSLDAAFEIGETMVTWVYHGVFVEPAGPSL